MIMARTLPALVLAGGLLTALSACAAVPAAPAYEGAEPVGMGDDLYGFHVSMSGARDASEVEAYVTCVVAGFAVEKNAGFARRVLTNVKEEGGVWVADAVYSISPTLPRGMKTIDAEVAVADCAERGIPTV